MDFGTDTWARHEPSTGKLSDIVYAKIVGLISSGDYGVNSRLPTEVELSELMAVSRPVVREALARLREDGVVVSRRGSGTYVLSTQGTAGARLGALSSIDDMRYCLEFRRSVEGDCAYYAALNKASLTRIETAVARLEASMATNEIPADEDFAFHLAIAQHTGNRFFETTIAALQESVVMSMGITRSFLMPQGVLRMREVHEEHLAIVDAIARHDAEGARKAMHKHLDNVIIRAFGSSR